MPYKLVAMVIANRLKFIPPNVISENQSTFLPGRLITNNILVANEIIHILRQKMKGKQCFMFMKLYISKAYDGMEWHYLKRVMEAMGLNAKMVTLIMESVTSASFSILINGTPKGHIISSIGLK